MPEPSELLHAYRSLLRAASYLPDSFARTHIRNSIIFRFESTTRKLNSKNGLPQAFSLANKLAEARANIRWLERAGQGSVPDLKKVLLHAYGRTGKRKRVLVNSLLVPEEADLPQDEAALKKLIHNPEEKELRYSKKSKLSSFLRSLVEHHPSTSAHRPLKSSSISMPKQNIWGRSIPLKAQKGLQRKWWAATLHKVLPPVPEHEWNRLRDLATGRIPVEDSPVRRARKAKGQGQKSDLLQYLRTPEKHHVHGVKGVVFDADVGLMPTANVADEGQKEILARSMRRLYAFVWIQTPMMVQDEETKSWLTIWGKPAPAHTGEITQATEKHLGFFKGLDEATKGKPVSKTMMKKLRKNSQREVA